VLITNGGYGAVNHAFSLGVPIAVAGESEDKDMVAARVGWTGAGINLKNAIRERGPDTKRSARNSDK
jgi:UDP:flavonoid glycosyltransferase YjiC (YdhE family)